MSRRYHSESWDEALARVPALAEFAFVALNDPAMAKACELIDTMPNFELVQVLPGSRTVPSRFLFREVLPQQTSPSAEDLASSRATPLPPKVITGSTPRQISDREWAAQPANLREGCTVHVPGVGDL